MQRIPPSVTPIPTASPPQTDLPVQRFQAPGVDAPASDAPEEAPAPAAPRRRFHFVTFVGWLTISAALPVLLSHGAVALLRWVPPPTTAFMLQSETQPVDYRWVPAARMAEPLRKAVIASEDQKFWDHNGFDFEAIESAIEHNRNSRRVRGASTISQQVAKNLFLWPGRSWVRKGLEVYGTLLIELLWTKQRILEVYLNVAEFGPGIYGVEAAAQEFFGKSAAEVTPEEAARLAAVLPNPRHWRAGSPGPYVRARTQTILALMGYRQPEPVPQEELVPPSIEEPAPDPALAPEVETRPYPAPEAPNGSIHRGAPAPAPEAPAEYPPETIEEAEPAQPAPQEEPPAEDATPPPPPEPEPEP